MGRIVTFLIVALYKYFYLLTYQFLLENYPWQFVSTTHKTDTLVNYISQ